MKIKAIIGLTGFVAGLGLGLLLGAWKESTANPTPVIQPTHLGEPHKCGVESLSISKPEKGFEQHGTLMLKFSRDEASVIRDIIAIHAQDSKASLEGMYAEVLADKFATVTGIRVTPKYVYLEWYAGPNDDCADVTVNRDSWKIRRVDYGGPATRRH